ncbi:nucleotidyltransferase domain-containing protein [Microbulbifer sp. THAF38]|uniref:nucleotidyltransferase domain-containing protein n=1 Tax=Microbulbifer sp. THAF38 TaxID=2587856 RepID=UPI0012696A04|nr:nucleotidyltransferase domain-containing protein [Microbulbifer sp. THAF38]QFT55215.1 putative nucleotidyltransferase [Microbulbifer sp. THAF38]
MELVIQDRLKTLEAEKGIETLYACESGSRAWGFESPDSDWDVRFIYKRDLNHYLTLGNPRDVVEVPFDKALGDELDLVGWDISKALGLLRGSNPTLIEWLFSPKVYLSQQEVLDELRSLAKKCWQPRALAHHYISMGFNCYSKFARKNDEGSKEIQVKKLLYVMRSILNALYIKRFMAIPPVDFMQMCKELLVNAQEEWLLQLISSLIEKKKGLDEGSLVVLDARLDNWIQENLDRGVANSIEERPKLDIADFDRLFHRVLGI